MAVSKCCPMCDLEMEYELDDPSVGIVGGWYCYHCDYSAADYDDHSDDWEDWR